MARGYEFLGYRNGANPANVLLESGLGVEKYISCWCHRKKFNEKASRGRNESQNCCYVPPVGTCCGTKRGGTWHCWPNGHLESLFHRLDRLTYGNRHATDHRPIHSSCLQDPGFHPAEPLLDIGRLESDGPVPCDGSWHGVHQVLPRPRRSGRPPGHRALHTPIRPRWAAFHPPRRSTPPPLPTPPPPRHDSDNVTAAASLLARGTSHNRPPSRTVPDRNRHLPQTEDN